MERKAKKDLCFIHDDKNLCKLVLVSLMLLAFNIKKLWNIDSLEINSSWAQLIHWKSYYLRRLWVRKKISLKIVKGKFYSPSDSINKIETSAIQNCIDLPIENEGTRFVWIWANIIKYFRSVALWLDSGNSIAAICYFKLVVIVCTDLLTIPYHARATVLLVLILSSTKCRYAIHYINNSTNGYEEGLEWMKIGRFMKCAAHWVAAHCINKS